MEHSIVASGLVKRFGNTKALDGVGLQVPAGSVFGLLGPNGAGKTTLVRILTTLSRPDSGQALVHGHDVVREPHLIRQLIGLAGQYATLDEALTGAENLLLIGWLVGLPRREARSRAKRILADFQLDGVANRAVKTYSGGMRRRLDLAASLVGNPEVLFLDEPTTGLDPRARSAMWEIVRKLASDGVTVLLTTQYLDEADQLAHGLAIIDRGRIVATGTPQELKAQAAGRSLAVHPADPGAVETVVSVVRSVIPAAKQRVRDARVTVAVQSAAVIPAIVRGLNDAGVVLRELSFQQATLDEVFLRLTERTIAGDPDRNTELGTPIRGGGLA